MNSLNFNKIIKHVCEVVATVPGVANLLNAKLHPTNNTHQCSQYIEVIEQANAYEINIKIGLINGINVKDVCQEVQIRIRYNLEQNLEIKNKKPFIINIIVDNIIEVGKE